MKARLNPLIGAIIGTFVAWVAAPWIESGLWMVVPASRWLEVHSIEVANSRIGSGILLRVDQEVHRSFAASWTVTLHQEVHRGFAPFCTRHGRNEYRAESQLPPETDLNWWMDVPPNPPCKELRPGNYLVTFTWTLDIPGVPQKVIRAESNIFEVK